MKDEWGKRNGEEKTEKKKRGRRMVVAWGGPVMRKKRGKNREGKGKLGI